ncbi:hypothetical protein LTR86_003181 [Recurvomyces mirabilis]|nr:hypothetical protein LTR86_003181 [Recurvomyces mirabilis]
MTPEAQTYDILLNLYNPLVNHDPAWYERMQFIYHMPRAQTYSLAPLTAWLEQINPVNRRRINNLTLHVDLRLLESSPWWLFGRKRMARREFEKSLSRFAALWRQDQGFLDDGKGFAIVPAPRAGERERKLGDKELERFDELEMLLRMKIKRARNGDPEPESQRRVLTSYECEAKMRGMC